MSTIGFAMVAQSAEDQPDAQALSRSSAGLTTPATPPYIGFYEVAQPIARAVLFDRVCGRWRFLFPALGHPKAVRDHPLRW